jgi:hypothetical protein
MRVNLKQVLKDYEGKDITTGTCFYCNAPFSGENKEEKKPYTLENVVIIALAGFEKDEPATAELKNKIFQLNLKIAGKKEVDLGEKERTFLQERIEKSISNPLLYGRAIAALKDPEEATKEDSEKDSVADENTEETPA